MRWDAEEGVGRKGAATADRDDESVGVDISLDLRRLEEQCGILSNGLLRLGGRCINGGDGGKARKRDDSQENQTTAPSVHRDS